ncbi:hypothetical protein TWF696_007602 [Orbilia brochopaga]|uniref:Uncharacterized protein n=1 Tax=Orbilia brochopaga TaxID=3140254 RepID=A0AAV9UPC2_9PEZI
MHISTLVYRYIAPAIVLYSGLSMADSALIPNSDDWSGTDCRVGLWAFGNYNSDDGFRGGPSGFEDKPPTDGSCQFVNTEYANNIESFKVGGDCDCTFYDDDKCQVGLFSAHRRWDGSLKNNGGNDNKIESYSCRYSPGASCAVSLWSGCGGAALFASEYTCGSHWEKDILFGKDPAKGEESDCFDITNDDGVAIDRISGVGVSNFGCGCKVYDMPGCLDENQIMDFRAPNQGGIAFGKHSMTVQSVKCYFNPATIRQAQAELAEQEAEKPKKFKPKVARRTTSRVARRSSAQIAS